MGKNDVTFFLPSLEPGGAERNVVNILNNINRKKYKIKLVLGERKGDFIEQMNKDIPIVNLGAKSSFMTFLKLANYFKEQEPAIFVSAFSRINIISVTAKLASKAKTKIVLTEHSLFSFLPVIAKTAGRRLFARLFMPYLAKIFYPKSDKIICVSKGIKKDISKITGASKKLAVVYNPVASEKIHQLSKQAIANQEFLTSKIPLVVAAGRLVKCKDYPSLLKAFSLVLARQPAHLLILGRGPEEDNLRSLANELSLTSYVTFLGFQKNPYKFMKRAKIFVLSSSQEGFGNVIVEAMTLGVPVVSTDCPTGPGEIIENGKNGILVPVGDEKSLAGAILKILESPSLAEKFSIEGKKRAEHFSVKRSVQGYEKVFNALTKND